MQGRLHPPKKGAYQEFPGLSSAFKEIGTASSLGFSHIELIADKHSENFLCTEPWPFYANVRKDIEKFVQTGNEKDVTFPSICADIFMEDLIIEKNKKTLEYLMYLINYARMVGTTYIVLPFVDKSSLSSKDIPKLRDILLTALNYAKTKYVYFCLETDLEPKEFLFLIKKLNHPNIRVNYDTGNSASLGYDIDEEFKIYGKYITSIHIKDRKLKGSSVELGTGNVDWKKFFSNLRKIKFKGVMTMQAARAIEDESEISVVKNQLETFLKFEEQYGS